MRLLFVCVGNSCRSQMAEGIARHLGHEAASAGTHPASQVSENALKVLQSKGISIDGLSPKSVDLFSAKDFDMVISMGCGVSCPAMRIDQDWGLDDPVGKSLHVFEATAEEIERRLSAL
ncbi:MAG TPA: arsenate reductase ArsC [Candidatus Poseidoniaceae archaeon]|nr:low molecular weight phosphatase family protein [Euryarchaeota archaeon]HII57035.1 arsenate reductase ArsC [Candidatus Poseidoniaceae archaeon]